MGKMDIGIYNADITAGSLKVAESRIIADLLLRHLDSKEFELEVREHNVLQAKSRNTAIRLARLIRNRLEPFNESFLRVICEGSGIAATHAVFAAAVKHSRLLADFLLLVVAEQHRLFASHLTKKSFDDYLDSCRERDSEMPLWNESTRKRLRSSVFQMLAQAGYIESTRTLKLQRVHIANEVLRYLEENKEEFVLRCLHITA